jgi:hypothetical protein
MIRKVRRRPIREWKLLLIPHVPTTIWVFFAIDQSTSP